MVLGSAQGKRTERHDISRVVLFRPLLLIYGTAVQKPTDRSDYEEEMRRGIFLEMLIRALQRELSRGNVLLCQSSVR